MPHEGEVIGRLRDGTEIKQMTDAEVESAGGKRHYRLVGHSHWCPAWFFGMRADNLAKEAAQFREAAMMITLHERRKAGG